MSDVALKRKTATLKISNQKSILGFSLNNPRRVGAHTGEPQTQTPFRGTGIRGHGGNINGNIQKSQYICADSFSIPHKSVMNTRGLISSKYRCMVSYPNSVVKKCEPPSYDVYLNKIKGQTAKQTNPCDKTSSNGSCVAKMTMNNGVIKMNYSGNYQKDILNMNYGTYYKSNIFVKNSIPLPAAKAHYPPQNVRPVSACIHPVSLEEFQANQVKLTSAGC
jgi:hypothetical protein